MGNSVILVVDFGTSNVHGSLVSLENGTILYHCSRKYPMVTTQPGYAELDPEQIWENAQLCVQELMEKKPDNLWLKTMTFSYFGDSLVLVDKRGEPLTNLLLCFDTRGMEEARWLENTLGRERFMALTGGSCYHFATPAKMLWIQRHHPDIYKLAGGFWSVQQYIHHKLGLPPVTDVTMGSRKSMMDITTRKWSPELLAATDTTEKQMGDLVETGDLVGVLTRFGCVRLGGPVQVIAGGHDCDCGLLGVGIHDETQPMVGEITGTYDHVGFLSGKDANLALQDDTGTFLSYCAPVEGQTISMSSFPTCGALLEWFMREIVGDTSPAAYERLWSQAQFAGTNPVSMHPDFSTGGGVGPLYLGTTRQQMFEALIESLTYESRRLIDMCRQFKKQEITTVRIGGGPSRSDVWMQLRADILGLRFERMESIECSTLGAALRAAVSTGEYDDMETAVARMIRLKDVFEPNMQRNAVYEQRYRAYLNSFERN